MSTSIIAAAENALVDFTSVDFTVISDGIGSAIPSALPVVLTIVGIRKVISFVMGMLRGA